jgi:hypothetical protein
VLYSVSLSDNSLCLEEEASFMNFKILGENTEHLNKQLSQIPDYYIETVLLCSKSFSVSDLFCLSNRQVGFRDIFINDICNGSMDKWTITQINRLIIQQLSEDLVADFGANSA